jgi:radical SAM superfamily enzyme YgiQ (UPF0313 family)
MYKDKKFRIKDVVTIKNELNEFRKIYKSVNKIFLADGDALILKTLDLVEILKHISLIFPECKRVTAYATPRDILNKSDDELKLIKSHGLTMVYMGIESGSDIILNEINKGVSQKEIIKAGKRVINSNIKLSVTLISGLGGIKNWKEHAKESAKVISKINPDYLGLLTLMIERDTELYKKIESSDFILLSPKEILYETFEFIKDLDVTNCIFRSNHASNYIALSGNLNKDKSKLLKEIESVLNSDYDYKNEQMRSL